ncbi:MAG: carbohydrate kinase [Kiritimatiellae bacterium]|nr:carbohydrate kinase [Kiritimatiellia bacterium]
MKLIAGLDIGTTGCKVTVFTAEGENLGREYRDYPVRRAVDAQEIDAVALAESVRDCVRSAKSRFGRIEAMGVTSFGEAFVLAGSDGAPLRPVMLCTDARGAEECRAFCEKFGAGRAAEISGVKPSESYSFPKLMWVKAHEPDVYAKARHVMLVEDYVVYLLTGNSVIDYSLAARTAAFDIRRLSWSDEILSAAGLDAAMFSRPAPTGAVVGVDADGMKVVVCGHDQVACAAGAGVFESDIAVEGAGTVECITPVFAKIPDGTQFQDDNYCAVPYFGSYVSYAYSYTGGELLRWCKDAICGRSHAEMQSGAYDGPTGLLVLPHFAGAATPYMDSGSRGAIVGLSLATTARDIYLACMEAVAYEMRLNTERLAASGVMFDRLVATGGGAKSKLWMQIKADVLGLPFTTLETEDAGTVGCAMMAGLAAGAFADLKSAAKVLVRRTGTFAPDAERHAKYSEVYKRYKGLYDAVRPLV